MFHDPTPETLPRAQLGELQRDRLRTLAAYVYERVGLYRERFDEAGVQPDQIRSLDDLRRLPFTRKSDLRDHYPFGLFAVPREEVVRIHCSSGTTGKPTVVGYTRADVELFAEVNARSLAMLGARARDDVPQRARLRAVHRRTRLPLRRRAARDDGRARLGRDDRAAAGVDHRLPARGDHLHAELRAHAGAGVREAGHRARRDQPALRGRRRRAVDGVDAGRDRPRPRRAHARTPTACRR